MSASAIRQQPPGSKEGVASAFPDLRPPDNPEKWSEDLFRRFPLPIPADASPLRKVQLLHANEGAAYLKAAFENVRKYGWNPWYRSELIAIASEICHVAADQERTPAARIPWYEDQVRILKAVEGLARRHVMEKTEPPRVMHHVCFYRLQAEAELLQLQRAAKQFMAIDSTGSRSSRSNEPWPQNEKESPPFTAFLQLKPPEINDKLPDLLFANFPLAVPTNASVLRRVQLLRANEGAAYLRTLFDLMTSEFSWRPRGQEFAAILWNHYRTLAETEQTPAARIPWYADRVIVLKAYEEIVRSDVKAGDHPPEDLHLSRCRRLEAEAELLKLKEEIEMTGNRVGIAGSQSSSSRPAKPDRKSYVWGNTPTAFPDLKPPGKDRPDGAFSPRTVSRLVDFKRLSEDLSKRFPLPVAADASPLRKVQLLRVNEGAAYLKGEFEAVLAGEWELHWFWSHEFATIATELYRIAAELDSGPECRLSWYKERVVLLKALEEFIRVCEMVSSNPPLRNHLIRFYRLGAEAELLKLEESLVPAASPTPIMICPPQTPRCRPRFFLSRWR